MTGKMTECYNNDNKIIVDHCPIAIFKDLKIACVSVPRWVCVYRFLQIDLLVVRVHCTLV